MSLDIVLARHKKKKVCWPGTSLLGRHEHDCVEARSVSVSRMSAESAGGGGGGGVYG